MKVPYMIRRQTTSFIKDAIFLSYSALNDFLNCPRAYYLKNVCRDPKSGYKIQIASPFLSLGATVHDTIKWYLEGNNQPAFLRVSDQFRNLWLKYHGKRGGFTSLEEEGDFGRRGLKMLENFLANVEKLEKPLPLGKFPKYRLSENIVLMGNMDYVGELADKTLRVIDFKTGSKDEATPLQLAIYAILAENEYGQEVSQAAFWYLDRDDGPKRVELEPLDNALQWLTGKGRELKKTLERSDWVCAKGDELCRDCRNYQAILDGEGEFMFSDHLFRKEVYFLPRENLGG